MTNDPKKVATALPRGMIPPGALAASPSSGVESRWPEPCIATCSHRPCLFHSGRTAGKAANAWGRKRQKRRIAFFFFYARATTSSTLPLTSLFSSSPTKIQQSAPSEPKGGARTGLRSLPRPRSTSSSRSRVRENEKKTRRRFFFFDRRAFVFSPFSFFDPDLTTETLLFFLSFFLLFLPTGTEIQDLQVLTSGPPAVSFCFSCFR